MRSEASSGRARRGDATARAALRRDRSALLLDRAALRLKLRGFEGGAYGDYDAANRARHDVADINAAVDRLDAAARDVSAAALVRDFDVEERRSLHDLEVGCAADVVALDRRGAAERQALDMSDAGAREDALYTVALASPVRPRPRPEALTARGGSLRAARGGFFDDAKWLARALDGLDDRAQSKAAQLTKRRDESTAKEAEAQVAGAARKFEARLRDRKGELELKHAKLRSEHRRASAARRASLQGKLAVLVRLPSEAVRSACAPQAVPLKRKTRGASAAALSGPLTPRTETEAVSFDVWTSSSSLIPIKLATRGGESPDGVVSFDAWQAAYSPVTSPVRPGVARGGSRRASPRGGIWVTQK
ncbi:hypothetical protein M885DRAFT_624605 [Pelagophyceae sp. CCMP2097]|nr:hypothetical protein M885DRAFT_624605 [Pelagophyceae sp. CCMP2097]